MAAVTVATGYPKFLVNGNYREYIYKINIAADADTLQTPLTSIVGVNLNDDGVSAVGVASVSGGLITFNSGGAINNCFCRVIGW